MMLKRTAKSCRSDAPMLASSLREEAQATVSNKPGHRGEHEVSRKTIARGMPGLLRCTCGDYARVLYLFRTRGCGCIGRPAFPAPSDMRAERSCTTSGASRRGIAESYLNAPSLRGARRRSNPHLLRGNMDCFASLAMTVSRQEPSLAATFPAVIALSSGSPKARPGGGV